MIGRYKLLYNRITNREYEHERYARYDLELSKIRGEITDEEKTELRSLINKFYI